MTLADDLLPKVATPAAAGALQSDIGVPECDPTAGPHATGRNGYEWDAFCGQAQLADIHPPWIPFHNMRQIHISEIAWVAGLTAPSLREIEKCRPKWTDVEHYWSIVSFAGFLFYEYGLNSKGSFALRLVEAGGLAGLFEIARKTALPLVGITI
jgi:hypothetical protein